MKGDPAAIEAAAENLATAEGQYNAALGESELGLGYKASPILGPAGPQSLPDQVTAIGYRVGDVGPLVGNRGAVRLQELLGHTGHTLLLLAGEASASDLGEQLDLMRRIADRHPAHVKPFAITRNAASGHSDSPPRFVDPTGEAHARLVVGEGPCLCLVRPDGHLGLRVTPPEISAVEAYLARILR